MLLHPSSAQKMLGKGPKRTRAPLRSVSPAVPPQAEFLPAPPTRDSAQQRNRGHRGGRAPSAGAARLAQGSPALHWQLHAWDGCRNILQCPSVQTRRRKIPFHSRGRKSRLTPAPWTLHPAPHMKHLHSFSRGFLGGSRGGEGLKRRKLSVLLLRT